MLHFVRRSLLVQLLGVYLLFVAAVLGTYLEGNAVAQQQATAEVQSTDLALAQEIVLDTDAKLRSVKAALIHLSQLDAVRRGDVGAMAGAFSAFKTNRQDLNFVYWLDDHGTLQVSNPPDIRTQGAPFAGQDVFQRARFVAGPIVEDGIGDLTIFKAAVTLAIAVRDRAGHLRGVLATSLLLSDLNQPLQTVIAAQARQHQSLVISIVDAAGRL